MRNTLLSLGFHFFFFSAFTQTNTNWNAFNQSIDASPYRGKRYRVEAAVKVQLVDSSAEAELWTRVDRPDKQIGFFYNMMDKPIRDPEWKLYHIQGKVAKDATRIFFGGLYQGKAIFYFDAFRFFIESSKNVWEEISLPDNGFENDTSVISTAWKYSRNNVYYVSEVCSTEFFQGAHAFRVDGTKSIAAESYGNNSKIGRFADVNNIRIYYEIYGSGAPLLLLHGNSSSISSFEKQIPALAKQFRVIAVDSRGQGKSTEDGKTYTYDLFAEDMNAFLDHLHLDSVNIVGWSDGGNTGLIMAMNYPSRVRKLVTMGANIFINDHVVEKWVFKTLNKEKKDLLRDNYPGSANRLRLINLLLTEPKHHFDELNRVTCPVLVMAGEKDVIKESHTRNIAQAIPGSTLMIIPKATHYLPTEDAVTFNKAVIDFLK